MCLVLPQSVQKLTSLYFFLLLRHCLRARATPFSPKLTAVGLNDFLTAPHSWHSACVPASSPITAATGADRVVQVTALGLCQCSAGPGCGALPTHSAWGEL